MYKKIPIKFLLALFCILLLAVVLVQLSEQEKGKRSFSGPLLDFEANTVSRINIFPRVMQGKKLELNKINDQWMLTTPDQKSYQADQQTVSSLLNGLNGLKPEGVASERKDHWNTYSVSDSLGTRIKLFKGSETLAELIFGKVSYASRGTSSYVRLANNKTTYRIRGSQASACNRDADGFKNKTVVRFSPGEADMFRFSYPADSSIVLSRDEDKWKAGEQAADSAAVARLLNTLSRLNHYQLTDKLPGGPPLFRLIITGKMDGGPIELNGYQEKDHFVVSSSQNPDVWFEGTSLRDKIFPAQSSFLPKKD
ncbi:MAG: DUF4340 domain-containing protein [Mangrovibacterium sp.]